MTHYTKTSISYGLRQIYFPETATTALFYVAYYDVVLYHLDATQTLIPAECCVPNEMKKQSTRNEEA